MTLRLFINNHLIDIIEFSPPPYDRLLDFKSNVERRELYVKRMVRLIKNNNERALENKEWKVYLFIPVTEVPGFGWPIKPKNKKNF